MKLKCGKIALWTGMLVLFVLRVLQYIFVIDINGFFIRETLWQGVLCDALYWVMGLGCLLGFLFRFARANKVPALPSKFAFRSAPFFSVLTALGIAVYGVLLLLQGEWLGYIALLAALYFALLPLRMQGKGAAVDWLAFPTLAFPAAAAILMFFANFREINASENVVDTVARCALILMILSLTKIYMNTQDPLYRVGRNFYLFALLGVLSGPARLFALIYTGNLQPLQLSETVADILMWIFAVYMFHLCAISSEREEKKLKQLIYAHRGASADYPENTMLAFRKAIEQGADGIELDVQFTADHKIVVCHDATVNRTSNGKGKISETTYEELLMLDFGSYKGEEFAGEKIPLLSEVLELVKQSGLLLNIELKSEEIEDELEYAVSDMVQAYGLCDKVIYSSFDHEMLYRLKAHEPAAKIAALYSHTPYHAFDYMKELGVYAIHPSYKYLHGQNLCARALMEGWQVNVWTVDDVDVAKELIEADVTSLITNRPAYLRAELTK